ncbi:MAG: AGE family epimerase/isomerase [Desulfobulbaceae bacterium]|nr:AGE family epimerase/isomerase [Desulfobulbaceae bacterium]
MDRMHFTFSDMIAGYVAGFEWEKQDCFILKTSDDRTFEIKIADNCFAELLRNLGEPFVDCTADCRDMLDEGRFLFAYGIFYHENDAYQFEAKHLVFVGRIEHEFLFEQQDWWLKQVHRLGDFYLKAEFQDGSIDFRNYRTEISLSGEQTGSYRQETDTISRLVYGFASAYMLTGEDRYLETAEQGTRYLRDHFRCLDSDENICYWYHAIDVKGEHERKVLASEFGDDFDAIPAYEQIYALAGPTQTYRVTGDPAIENDIQLTINLFQKHFRDHKLGGYYSHIDPITFNGRVEQLGRNRSRKNWNSVGDHAPAYLINAVLATENQEWRDMLEDTADTITAHFQDFENSPFVNEKFHEDWSHDQTWGWQQNRAVVGHNLKIAWNLTRIQNRFPKAEYETFARKIAELMPRHGGDRQRCGWYDVVNRTLGDDEEFHRFAWHDRKAWWQQEQGILAYLILAGVHGDAEYLKIARESSSFYNAWFLDHDSGGVYFNVLANGLPYLMGTERKKGSHSMSGYHSFELAFLASVYNNLLITKQAMEFYFQPVPGGFKDNILRVAPDMLPEGSIRLDAVWIDGEPHADFDADALTVTLPQFSKPIKVKVRIVPTSGLEKFSMAVNEDRVILQGDLGEQMVPVFREQLARTVQDHPDRIILDMARLDSLCKSAVRVIIFEKQKMDIDASFIVIGANEDIKQLLMQDEFVEEIELQ